MQSTLVNDEVFPMWELLYLTCINDADFPEWVLLYSSAEDETDNPIRVLMYPTVIAHNHPSGSLEPSSEDFKMTSTLKEASQMLNIPLLDHVIFSKEGYYSFLESEKI
jgi:hypothetical protein